MTRAHRRNVGGDAYGKRPQEDREHAWCGAARECCVVAHAAVSRRLPLSARNSYRAEVTAPGDVEQSRQPLNTPAWAAALLWSSDEHVACADLSLGMRGPGN
jgi:hypothetical protein